MARPVATSDSQLNRVDFGTWSFLEMERRLQPLARRAINRFLASLFSFEVLSCCSGEGAGVSLEPGGFGRFTGNGTDGTDRTDGGGTSDVLSVAGSAGRMDESGSFVVGAKFVGTG